MRNFIKEIANLGIELHTPEWMEIYRKLTTEEAERQHKGG